MPTDYRRRRTRLFVALLTGVVSGVISGSTINKGFTVWHAYHSAAAFPHLSLPELGEKTSRPIRYEVEFYGVPVYHETAADGQDLEPAIKLWHRGTGAIAVTAGIVQGLILAFVVNALLRSFFRTAPTECRPD